MKEAPPDFATARTGRQKVRAAGMSPDYWYAVEYERAVRPGQVVEVRSWHGSIALFRGADGRLAAVENRCAHRQLKLTLGEVAGCNLVCTYHGWAYDASGKLASIPHDLFGKPMPSLKVKSYPLRVRYGLIWVYLGDPARADARPLPEIPELEGPGRWACEPLDFVFRAHHSMVVDNVNDFTHAYLHRKYRPFENAKLARLEAAGDRVSIRYDTAMGRGRISGLFLDRRRVDTSAIDLCYEYPYQWSSSDGKIKHWCFLLPIDARTTRVFFLFYFESFRIPFTPVRIPRWAMSPFLKLANAFLIRPLLEQDRVAVEAEQEGYEAHHDAPIAELNPAVGLCQQLTIRKWEEHLAAGASRAS